VIISGSGLSVNLVGAEPGLKFRADQVRLRSEMHVRGQTTVVRGHATLARLSEVIRGVSLHSLGDALDNLGYAPRELAHRGYRWTVVDFSGTLSHVGYPYNNNALQLRLCRPIAKEQR